MRSRRRRHPALDFDSPQRRRKTLEAFVTQVESLSRSEPVLMIFEDAHWTDPTSLELVGRILERIGGHEVVMQMRSFRRPDNPLGSSHFKVRAFDWDPFRQSITASGHTSAASKAGHVTAPDQSCKTSESS